MEQKKQMCLNVAECHYLFMFGRLVMQKMHCLSLLHHWHHHHGYICITGTVLSDVGCFISYPAKINHQDQNPCLLTSDARGREYILDFKV